MAASSEESSNLIDEKPKARPVSGLGNGQDAVIIPEPTVEFVKE